MGSRSRRADRALPVGSTRTDTKNPADSVASANVSLGGMAAGVSAIFPYGLSEGSLSTVIDGVSRMRMSAGGIGVGSSSPSGSGVGVEAGGPAATAGSAGGGAGVGVAGGVCARAAEPMAAASSAASGNSRTVNRMELGGV